MPFEKLFGDNDTLGANTTVDLNAGSTAFMSWTADYSGYGHTLSFVAFSGSTAANVHLGIYDATGALIQGGYVATASGTISVTLGEINVFTVGATYYLGVTPDTGFVRFKYKGAIPNRVQEDTTTVYSPASGIDTGAAFNGWGQFNIHLSGNTVDIITPTPSSGATVPSPSVSVRQPVELSPVLNRYVWGDGLWRFTPDPVAGYDVYWLIGQSNMVGRATLRGGIDDDYSAVSSKCVQFGYTSQTVKAATNPLDHVDETANTMGLWLEFVKARAVAAGRTILLVPCAQGGTSFNGNHWNPGNTLYNNALSRLSAAMTQGTGTNILKGVLWLQGESDADAGATAASNYQANLQAMYDAMVLAASGMNTLTPFIVGSIKPDKANAPAVNTGLANFAAANPAAAYVDLTDLAWYDTNHYTAASLATAGTRYAGAF